MTFLNTSQSVALEAQDHWANLRRGEKSSLEAIYRSHVHDLFNFGMRIHSDETLVKDSIQDVFIDLWNYRSKLCSDVVVKQYLFKALSNRIQKELGKSAKRSAIHWMSEQETLISSPEQDLINDQQSSELSSKMREALEDLPIRQKEVIQYLYFEKLSYEDTSRLLDITIRSTYTLAWKAINALKKSILVFITYCFIL
ncbi:RNA polymerase sigma factor [Algoriphagus machipongonensis]|uniref:RNA polymerase sigma factor, sigma-70 family n=1 Tax=Algoriphagus machipongonensis TaxID=388413 RepID=A3I017_9BACT|nr:sigma-70 family RNA polymerase sigma factor [Algoriphagus machipongonensis]EAZ80853.1 RNA polymerase sigma factor, sigma-70 family [Algoriphagus machipongonensis]